MQDRRILSAKLAKKKPSVIFVIETDVRRLRPMSIDLIHFVNVSMPIGQRRYSVSAETQAQWVCMPPMLGLMLCMHRFVE